MPSPEMISISCFYYHFLLTYCWNFYIFFNRFLHTKLTDISYKVPTVAIFQAN